MEYTNDEIKRLITERDAILEDYNKRIHSEILKEKAKYRLDKKALFLLLFVTIFPFIGFSVNKSIFPKTSIWSWTYWIGESISEPLK
jgi:hypothetical protein